MKTVFSLVLSLVCWQSNAAGIVNALPKEDRLAKVAKAIGTQLGDGNITSGRTELWAGQLKDTAPTNRRDAAELAEEGFRAAFKEFLQYDHKLPVDAKLKITVRKFADGEDGTIVALRDAIMESNDYNPKNQELRAAQARYMWAVLRQLPVGKSTTVALVAVRLNDDVSGEPVNVRLALIFNRDGKAVLLFTKQGFM